MGEHGTNELCISERRYLLAGGSKTHLVGLAADQPGRPAVQDWTFESHAPWQDAYILDQLRASIWADRTICGRVWQQMHIASGPPITPWDDEPAHAPDCKSCLNIVGNGLASAPADTRLPLIAEIVVQEVVTSGEAQVVGVPGDQADLLRAEIRSCLRKHRLTGRTFHAHEFILVISEQAQKELPEDIRREQNRAAAEALGATIAGSPRPFRVDRRIYWDTWSTT